MPHIILAEIWQKELQIIRVNNIAEFCLNTPFQKGVNYFSCLMNVRARIGELEEVKCEYLVAPRIEEDDD